jgi:hypothetical protein
MPKKCQHIPFWNLKLNLKDHQKMCAKGPWRLKYRICVECCFNGIKVSLHVFHLCLWNLIQVINFIVEIYAHEMNFNLQNRLLGAKCTIGETHGKIVNCTQNLFARLPMIKNAYDMLRQT